MATGLEAAFLLDRRWHAMRGEMETTKEETLRSLARVLDSAGLPWAVIGGVALQIHRAEPRTTLDVDVAVSDRAALPSDGLVAAGFRRTGRFAHSENWISADGVPVQFTDDPPLRPMVARAERLDVAGLSLRVLAKADLVREKLRASADPERRRSKRVQDLSDALGLVEDDPALRSGLTDAELARLDSAP
jgi:hypothetical protein